MNERRKDNENYPVNYLSLYISPQGEALRDAIKRYSERIRDEKGRKEKEETK